MLRISCAAIALLLVGAFAQSWTLFVQFFSATTALPRDNASLHLPVFEAVAAGVRHFGIFSDWLYAAGTPTAILANNALVLAPYKLVGYALAFFTDLPLALLYKISVLIVGPATFLAGVFFFFRLWFRDNGLAFLGTLLAAFSSLCLCFAHQEQALGTAVWLPWLWYFALRAREEIRFLPLTFAVLGLSLLNHYPQLIAVYVALVLCFSRPRKLFDSVTQVASPWRWSLSVILFLCAALPALYTYANYKADLVSPFRNQSEGISATSFEEYLAVNQLQLASVAPENLWKYLRGSKAPTVNLADLDDSQFFVHGLLVVLLLSLALVRPRHLWFHLPMVMLLAMLTLGIHTPLAKLLWQYFPGIAWFRQYYYFVVFLNFHLLWFSVDMLRSLREFFPRSAGKFSLLASFSLATFALGLVGFLEPGAAALGAVFFLAVFVSANEPARPLRLFLLGGVFALSAVQGFQSLAKRTLQRMESASPPIPSGDGSPLLQGQALLGPPVNPMVAHRSTAQRYFLRANQPARPLWRTHGGALLPIENTKVALKLSPVEMSLVATTVPLYTHALVLPWFVDDGWLLPRGSLGLYEIPVSQLPLRLTAKRVPSPWTTTVGISCLALLVGILSAVSWQQVVKPSPAARISRQLLRLRRRTVE